ncbi:Chloroplastic import inner membrane translocase subunit TIM22-2 [Camellia lanceoleosa]|uniref:Chloroplastic import inner membrane translocase subunit TIM22-2 n=1 Tax=Camellia lanceoleosa TaxID=1840588 RepID=A0ACC0GMI4_9ERIC|nr:Chloroplastic import inner membrane translocase subunit TIM22-2 [Camellia lanceoleosa]
MPGPQISKVETLLRLNLSDLNSISTFGSISSRPHLDFSHRESLEKCIQYVRRWLSDSLDFISEAPLCVRHRHFCKADSSRAFSFIIEGLNKQQLALARSLFARMKTSYFSILPPLALPLPDELQRSFFICCQSIRKSSKGNFPVTQ